MTLLDRAEFPRDKPCGDLIGTNAIALLRRIGIEIPVVAATAALRGAFVYAPDGRRIGSTLSAATALRFGARVIPRRDFDSALVDAAIAAGATFRCARVTAVERNANGAISGVRLADGATLNSQLTIGADGWTSIVARAIVGAHRVPSDAGIAVRVYVENLAPSLTADNAMRFYVGAPGDGYGWIFPLGQGRANVGLGFIRGEPGANAMHAAFARFLRRPELRDAQESGSRQAWPIPFGWRNTPLSAAGALLAGDAASLASSLSGSGIHAAIESGAIAAEVALTALQRDDVSAPALRSYDRRLRRIANRLRFERYLHVAVGTASGSARAIRLANCIPGTGRLAVGWFLNLG